MKFNKLMSAKGMMFLLLFSAMVFFGDRINFSKLMGAENQFFTLFQFFGPIAGVFLGPAVGVLSVLIAEVGSYVVLGKAFTLVSMLRLLPMMFAAWYFGTRKSVLNIFTPVAAILLFIVHPVGRQVWYFSLFWTIPIIVKILPKRYSEMPVLKSLGATFTAHSVGGAMWNYIVPMTPAAWIALIPVVIFERLVFTAGITASYYGMNTLLDRLDAKTKADFVHVEKKDVLFAQGS